MVLVAAFSFVDVDEAGRISILDSFKQGGVTEDVVSWARSHVLSLYQEDLQCQTKTCRGLKAKEGEGCTGLWKVKYQNPNHLAEVLVLA